MATVHKIHAMDVYPRIDAEDVCLLMFTKPGCGVCRAMVVALDDVDVAWPVFEVDAEGAAGLIDEHEVFHLPALFLYRGGEVAAPVMSAPVVSDLQAELATLLA